jgi:hypothetical protein
MLPLDTFHTIAEVGIAIAGFAGIVAAIRGAAADATQPSVGNAFGGLLGGSLGTVLFCFVPEWIHSAITAPDTVWRLSLGAYGTWRLAYIALILDARRRGAMANSLLANPLFPWIFLPASFIAVLQLIGAAGLLREFWYFLYLSGLLWGLAVALINFSVLLRSSTSE